MLRNHWLIEHSSPEDYEKGVRELQLEQKEKKEPT